MLAQLRKRGIRFLGPTSKLPVSIKSLIAKGYARELPGLLNGFPQGVEAIEPAAVRPAAV